MKYLIGFFVAAIISIIFMVFIDYLNFNREKWLFFVGWFSCSGFFITMDIFDILKQKPK
jgi:hypothetical protein